MRATDQDRPLSDFFDKHKLRELLKELKEASRGGFSCFGSCFHLERLSFSGKARSVAAEISLLFSPFDIEWQSQEFDQSLSKLSEVFRKVIEKLSRAEIFRVVCLDPRTEKPRRIVGPIREPRVKLTAILDKAAGSDYFFCDVGVVFSPAKIRGLKTGNDTTVPFYVFVTKDLLSETLRNDDEIFVTSQEELEQLLSKEEKSEEEVLFQIVVRKGTDLEAAEDSVLRAVKDGFRCLKEGSARSVRVEVSSEKTEVAFLPSSKERKRSFSK